MRLPLVFLIALTAGLPAWCDETPPKSACTERNHGTLWPPEANGDPALTQKQFAAGELWMCEGNYDWDAYFVTNAHFFRWKRLSIRWKRAAEEAQSRRQEKAEKP
jgi:hypothetical protein